MKKTFLIISLLSFLTLSIPALVKAEEISLDSLENMEELNAAELNLSEPTVIPGSALYPIKKIFEKIEEALTFREDSIIQLNLKLASKRLLEARKLLKLGKNDLALQALENYNARIEKIKERMQKLEGNEPEKLKEKQKTKIKERKEDAATNYLKHIQVLEEVREKIENEKAKEAITNIIERSEERVGEEISSLGEEEAKEILDNVLDKLPGDEIGKIIYLQILRNVKEGLNDQAKSALETIETERVEKITKLVEQSKLSTEKQESILKKINEMLGKTQKKITKDLPETTRNIFDQLKQRIQEGSEEKDGSINILP